MVKQILGGGWTNPIETYATVKFNHFPRDQDEHKEIFKTTNQLYHETPIQIESNRDKSTLILKPPPPPSNTGWWFQPI